jgi:hypothetical protein
MPTYINTNTNEYPLYPEDMRVRFANFDDEAMPDGYAIAHDVDVPESTSVQRVDELFPILNDGTWTRQYVVIDLTEEQIAFRNQMLIESKQSYRNNNNDNLSGSAPNVIE